MNGDLLIEVVGTPAPQGSKRWVGTRMIESSKAVAPWRQAVAYAALTAIRRQGWAKVDGPVQVSVTFTLPRPPSAPKKRLGPDRKPDLDKLIRSTFDALSEAGVWTDDARVVLVIAEKVYGPHSGAVITVRPWSPDELGAAS